MRNLRVQGLETPLLQKRLVDAWPQVAGPVVIRNQTLWVRLSNPALRADMSMRRQEYIMLLNGRVGSQVITDIRFC